MTTELKAIKISNNAAGDITIKIPRSYLRHSVLMREDLAEGCRITNTKVFSDAVVRQMRHEGQGGNTVVDGMIDAAVDEAIEQGAEGVKLGDEE